MVDVIQSPNTGLTSNLLKKFQQTYLSVGHKLLIMLQTPNSGLAQNVIKTNLSSLRVTNSYAHKKKDSVPAALVQLHPLEQVTNYPDYIGLVQYFLSSIGGWDLNRINNIYSVQHHNLVNDIHSVDCLVLRCLRLISALAAVIKKPAVSYIKALKWLVRNFSVQKC